MVLGGETTRVGRGRGWGGAGRNDQGENRCETTWGGGNDLGIYSKQF